METWNQNRFLPLYKAALHGDWITANLIFDYDSGALTAKFLSLQETALHVAIRAGHSVEFVKKLLEKMREDSVKIANKDGDTPLHYAAIAGNTEAAKMLVKKDRSLTQTRNNLGDTPLHRAAAFGHKDTVSYLLSVTLDEEPSPFADRDGVRLINLLITADLYDVALVVLKCYPMLARRRDHVKMSALIVLSQKSQAFASGSQLGCFRRLLYHYFPSTSGLVHKQAMELLKLLISEALDGSVSEIDNLLGPPTRLAATLGIQEFVWEAIKSYPSVVWVPDVDGHTVFHLAVKHRQENIFNLLYQMGTHILFITSLLDRFDNNFLHLAAKLGPSGRTSGAALQMQRELQWFKEIEKLVQPSYRERRNKDWKSPRVLFSEEHKNLVKQGEKWLKDTATSCATVAALVVTAVFAAAFTMPGGNNNEGVPIYLNKTSFIIFAISDALGLLFSSTSLLMFLGILTSRCSEEDFFSALPMRIITGLIALFFSIATMVAAFAAAFYLVLFHKVKWIAIPIGLAVCAPVAFFAVLQFPLLLAMVTSTFGSSIFQKQGGELKPMFKMDGNIYEIVQVCSCEKLRAEIYESKVMMSSMIKEFKESIDGLSNSMKEMKGELQKIAKVVYERNASGSEFEIGKEEEKSPSNVGKIDCSTGEELKVEETQSPILQSNKPVHVPVESSTGSGSTTHIGEEKMYEGSVSDKVISQKKKKASDEVTSMQIIIPKWEKSAIGFEQDSFEQLPYHAIIKQTSGQVDSEVGPFGVNELYMTHHQKILVNYAVAKTLHKRDIIVRAKSERRHLTRDDLWSMLPDEYLYSAVIDMAAEALSLEESEKAIGITNWFLPALDEWEYCRDAEKCYEHFKTHEIRESYMQGSITRDTKIFIPIIDKKARHFYLVLIHIEPCIAEVWDSLSTRTDTTEASKQHIKTLLSALNKLFEDDLHIEGVELLPFTEYSIIFKSDSPKQQNGSDCGVMVINNMRGVGNVEFVDEAPVRDISTRNKIISAMTRLEILRWLLTHPVNVIKDSVLDKAIAWKQSLKEAETYESLRN